MKTICAISTPIGIGGISIIRMSGPESLNIAKKIFSPYHSNWDNVEPRKMYLGKIKTEHFTDKGLCVYFQAPNSYTGEDIIEFHLHGGNALTNGVLRQCIDLGASLAEPGEFTKRGFLNGKLSLSSAEGVIEMINAQSEAEVNAGYNLLEGSLNKQCTQIQNKITDILAELEAALDYPEEDLEILTLNEAKKSIEEFIKPLQKLKETQNTAKFVKDGIRIAIAGKPNVGKSSLLNALIQYDRAIVTDIPGTTRDTIDDSFSYKGINFIITDTAGLRNTDDNIEKLGIERSYKSIKNSDVVLFLIDDTFGKEDKKLLDDINKKNILIIKNKSDISSELGNADMLISAKNGDGIAELKECIYNMFIDNKIISGGLMLTNARHISAVNRALKSLNIALQADQPDLMAMDLKDAWDALGEITGTTVSETIIDRIFEKFCLGK
ncbi:MAG TPA: tRNA uridine-5-carboxymethylaminomethyl(34) synthesis GTPase MnmE [Clostridia bacterium]